MKKQPIKIRDIEVEFSDLESDTKRPFMLIPDVMRRCLLQTRSGRIISEDLYNEIKADPETENTRMSSYIGSLDKIESEHLFKRFTDEEMMMLQLSNVWSNDRLDEWVNSRPQLRLFKKIYLSSWHNGLNELTWSDAKKAYQKIITFDLGLNDDFDICIDWTTGYNGHGYSEHTRTYLDGELAYSIFYKGSHVMNLSFDICKIHGELHIRFNQLQTCSIKKGNRFLYKINKGDYMTYIIEKFFNHFSDFKVSQILPEVIILRSAGYYKNIRNNEGKEQYDKLIKNEGRIKNLYTLPLSNIRRYRNSHMNYYILKQVA